MALFQIAAIGSDLEIAGGVQDQVQLHDAVRDGSGSPNREQNETILYRYPVVP